MIKLGEGVLNVIYPIGSIYMSINPTNPGQIFGGTWSQIAQGRTLMGVDANDPDFNTSQKSGGNKKKAAEYLGIDRSVLYDKLNKYHMKNPAFPDKA